MQACLKATIAWFEHEARESFQWRGVNVFNPHYDVDALYEARVHQEMSFDTRMPLDIQARVDVGSFS